MLVGAGCQDRLSAVHPAGPAAEAIATLWWVLLGGATIVFLLVMALLALSFRRRGVPAAESGSSLDGGAEKEQRRDLSGDDAQAERVWLWGLGLAFPAITLAALTAYGLVVGERLLPRPAPDLVTVRAEARQWAWTFGYADAPGRTTQNVLHIPAGRPVDVEITSADVVHSFWVPRLAGKLDAIPGHVNILRIEAREPGQYAGASAEFSGRGYREHVFAVEAHGPVSWDAFLSGEVP